MAKETVKAVADVEKVTPVEAPKAVEAAKEVKADKVEKATAKKTTKKTTKKSAAKKTSKKVADAPKRKYVRKTTVEMFIQYNDNQLDEASLVERVKADVASQGVEAREIKIYLKPQDNACYYVANGNLAGRVDLF